MNNANNTQNPFFTTDNNGFNMRSVGEYFHTEVEGTPEDATYDAFDPEWQYFRVVDNNTIIFESEMTSSYAQWAHLIKIKRDNNGVWSHSSATAEVYGDNPLPRHECESYITDTEPDWNTL